MPEFSRRVNVEVFKDEPMTCEEWFAWFDEHPNAVTDEPDQGYARYLGSFQPYWWHAQSPNGEILSNGERYLHEDGAINSIELLFGDDTTVYYAPMFGEDRGFKWLRYGKTDRDAQAGQ